MLLATINAIHTTVFVRPHEKLHSEVTMHMHAEQFLWKQQIPVCTTFHHHDADAMHRKACSHCYYLQSLCKEYLTVNHCYNYIIMQLLIIAAALLSVLVQR